MVGMIPNEVFRDLLAYYQQAGLNPEIFEPNNPQTIPGEKSIKVNGRKFDLVILKFAGGSIGFGRGGTIGPSIGFQQQNIGPTLINFNYIVKGMINSNENDLKAELKVKTEGFISKKLVDVHWEGGLLAGQLNGDTQLKDTIMKSSVIPLKVEPDKKNNCVHIINEHAIREIITRSGIIVQKAETRVENFPPMETLDVIDKIATNVRAYMTPQTVPM
ncbi:MAG TPA: hypothetical protein VEF91_02030 [Verrucomicrobiae bacterium]|nr:hypothetical protein [Verrucomicrobiae bacterium]